MPILEVFTLKSFFVDGLKTDLKIKLGLGVLLRGVLKILRKLAF